jgi:Predicted membrane protein
MLIVPVRAAILYLLVVIIVRIMGKHQIGQLQPYELVITILISELAAVPMQDTDIPLINGIIPILTLLLIQITLSFISLKSSGARRIICGGPSVLIENGKIQQSELSKLRYSINDLLEQLRLKDIPNVADVEFAILETCGKLSVIPKSQKRPVNPEDLKLNTSYEGLPTTLIVDGTLQHHHLKKARLTEEWLRNELAKFGWTQWNQILLASLDSAGKLFIQPKETGSKSE